MPTNYVYFLFADDVLFAHCPTLESALAVFEIMAVTFPTAIHFELKAYETEEVKTNDK